EALEASEERLHRRVVARDAEARRLAHGERPEHRPTARRREERDNAPVGVADEVVALAQFRCDLLGLLLEVDPLERRPRRIAAACIVLGTVIGWAAGSVAYGLVFGAVVGIPVGVAVTILRYRNL